MNSRDRKYIKDLLKPLWMVIDEVKNLVSPGITKLEGRVENLENNKLRSEIQHDKLWHRLNVIALFGLFVIASITLLKAW